MKCNECGVKCKKLCDVDLYPAGNDKIIQAMKKVKFTKKTDQWFKNEVVTLTDEQADDAIKSGVAKEYVEKPITEETQTPLDK